MKNIYSRMIELFQDQLTKEGITQHTAISASAQVVERLRNDLGGVKVYLPRRHPYVSRMDRNRRMREEFNGRNIREVSIKFGVTTRTVRRVCCGKY